jgi:hypothetical protein
MNYREALRAVRKQRLAKERGRIPVEFTLPAKDREKLGALFCVWCDGVGTRDPDAVFGSVYHIVTVGGVFKTHYDPWSGSIFGRFEHPEEVRILGVNPYSGKWNVHTGRGEDPQAVFDAWSRAIERVKL